MDILKQLEEGDTLKVICGTRWHENYSMLFERGDYYFL